MSKQYLKLVIIAASILSISMGCSDATGEKLVNTPINVEVQKVNNFDGKETIGYSGTIEESETIPLSFSVVGNVSRVLINEGDYVRKGQLLAEINEETYKNTYEMSLASLKQAEDAYNRMLPMYKNGNLPEIKLVEVETGLQQAKSSTLIAKKNVDDCKLYSPIEGVVGKRSIDPGMIAMPNLTSIDIVKIEKVFARIPISENEISLVKKGNRANVKISALDNKEFTGIVEEIGVVADQIAHTYKVKIAILNKDQEIKPGMICNVTLEKSEKAIGITVPTYAVLIDEKGNNFVYLAKENKAVKKYVTMGRLLQNGVEILSGINAGDEIIVSGMQKLVDNSLVSIINQ